MRFIIITSLTTGLAFMALSPAASTKPIISQAETKVDTKKSLCGSTIATQKKFKWYSGRVYQRTKISKRSLFRLDKMRLCSLNMKANRNMLHFQRKLGKKRRARILADRVFSVRPHLRSIARCESHGNPRAISPSGKYRGKYQFSFSTWASVGGQGDPASNSEYEQDKRAEMLYKRSGPGQWPVCQHR
jgi:hypothetical protein